MHDAALGNRNTGAGDGLCGRKVSGHAALAHNDDDVEDDDDDDSNNYHDHHGGDRGDSEGIWCFFMIIMRMMITTTITVTAMKKCDKQPPNPSLAIPQLHSCANTQVTRSVCSLVSRPTGIAAPVPS